MNHLSSSSTNADACANAGVRQQPEENIHLFCNRIVDNVAPFTMKRSSQSPGRSISSGRPVLVSVVDDDVVADERQCVLPLC